jgi:4-amino-4-deoxy-L-arabinose transferase-like glycosyltransferase
VQRRLRVWPSVAAIAVAAAVLRALAFSATELYSDEAYYWLWSLRPAAGYYDHPPLVAWLIALTAPLARGELGVRLAFLVAGALTVVFAALLARELALSPSPPRGERDGARGSGGEAPGADARTVILHAALLTAAAPLLSIIGAMALPDAPVAAAYTAALWLLARARGTRWLWAGAAVGVALLAKYTAALLAPALLFLVLWDGELRRELRTPWPWLGALLATAMFLPCLLWNARHDWVSIRFQLGHGFNGNATLGSFVEYVAGQLAGAGPVALAGGALLLLRSRGSAEKRVAAATLLPLLVTTWSALRGKVEANWPALAYPALCAAAAVALARLRPRVARALVLGSVALTAALLAVFAAEQRHPRLLAGTPVIERFHGWRALAAQARSLQARACGEVGCDALQPFVVSANYQYAAELAYYGGFRRLGPAVERASQLDVWGERPRPDEPFLFVGFEGVTDGFRRAFRAEGERATERVSIVQHGERLRTLSLTPFARYAGEVPRS